MLKLGLAIAPTAAHPVGHRRHAAEFTHPQLQQEILFAVGASMQYEGAERRHGDGLKAQFVQCGFVVCPLRSDLDPQFQMDPAIEQRFHRHACSAAY